MITREKFIHALKHPEVLDQSTLEGLKEMISDYPAFPAARMLYLRNLRMLNSYKFESELLRHAVYIPDRAKLYRYLLLEVAEQSTEFELLPYDESAISRLFGTESPKHHEELHSFAPFELTPNQPGKQQQDGSQANDLIDRFIIENPTIKPVSAAQEKPGKSIVSSDDVLADGLITETLAGIYVKQGLYAEALNAYQKLSLKFPEKNSYFATQIEEIKKLMSKES